MLKYGNKEFRNLEEQVLKNKEDIASIVGGTYVLDEFGIKVIGQVETDEDLPTVEEYKEDNPGWEYGDAFAIGTEAPYTLKILTRANDFSDEDYWFNIGRFPEPGPQGEKGEKGDKGDKGDQGERGLQGIRGPKGDTGATGATGQQGIQGIQGPRGDTGATGAQGPQGPQGPQGNVGPQGPQGLKGDTGEQGPQGEPGQDGAIQYTAGENITISDDYVISATGGGAVDSVNGQTGVVVLDAGDILATNSQSVQANLERIDSDVEDVIDELAEKATTTYVDEAIEGLEDSKQDKLTAGQNITILNNVISATTSGTEYTAGDGISIEDDEISVDDTIARTSEIPTNYVTTNTEQFITGTKHFDANTNFDANTIIGDDATFKVNNCSSDPHFAWNDGSLYDYDTIYYANGIQIIDAENEDEDEPYYISFPKKDGTIALTKDLDGKQDKITSTNKLSYSLLSGTPTIPSGSQLVSTSDRTNWNGKQSAISDLTTIRSGAAAGATAVQPSAISNMVTTDTVQTITGKKTFEGSFVYDGWNSESAPIFTYDDDESSGLCIRRGNISSTNNTYIKTLAEGNKTVYFPNKEGTIALTSDVKDITCSTEQVAGGYTLGSITLGEDSWNITGGGSSAWGSITGTITDQTDLVSYIADEIAEAIGDAIEGEY